MNISVYSLASNTSVSRLEKVTLDDIGGTAEEEERDSIGNVKHFIDIRKTENSS
jgi:hypothetical protein